MSKGNHVNMTKPEIELLQKHLSMTRHYLEFGAGTSTGLAVRTPGIESIDSVESSKSFIDDHLLNQPDIREATHSKRLKMHWIDLGPTGNWGVPTDRTTRPRWPAYSSKVFLEPTHWDLVLIDGRFRVACGLNAILHTGPDCRILIHDFWWRPEYFLLLEFLEVIDRLDSLAVLQRKGAVDTAKVEALYAKYCYLPSDKTFPQRVRSFVVRKLSGKA